MAALLAAGLGAAGATAYALSPYSITLMGYCYEFHIKELHERHRDGFLRIYENYQKDKKQCIEEFVKMVEECMRLAGHEGKVRDLINRHRKALDLIHPNLGSILVTAVCMRNVVDHKSSKIGRRFIEEDGREYEFDDYDLSLMLSFLLKHARDIFMTLANIEVKMDVGKLSRL